MAVNKIIFNGGTILDLSADTVSSAADIVSGKIGHLRDGSQVTGTAESGSSSWTKIGETSYSVSTTSTSNATVGTWATGDSSIWTADQILYIRIRDEAGKQAGYFYGSDNFFLNFTAANGSSTYGALGMVRIIWSYTSSSIFAWRYGYSTTGYGVFPDYVYSNGRIRIRSRYHSTYSLTIDGTYLVEAYLLDPAGGVLPFA